MTDQDQAVPDTTFTAPAPKATTRLYPLPPKAYGTGQAESCLSYIARLSAAHNVSRVALCTVLDELEGIPKNQTVRSLTRKLRDDDQTLLPALMWATGRPELARCTLGTLAKAVSCESTLHLTRIRFCPECVREVPYPETWSRILWEIDCVDACPVHKILLVESICGAKTARHPTWVPGNWPGICHRCGALSFGCQAIVIDGATPDQCWVAEKVGEMIACATGGEVFAVENAFFGLESALYARWNSLKDAEADMGLTSGRLTFTLQRVPRVNLRILLLVGVHAGFEPISILRGNLVSCDTPKWTLEGFAKNKKRLRTRSEISSQLNEIRGSSPDISVGELLRITQVSRVRLNKLFPEEMQDVRRRHHDLLRRRRWRRLMSMARRLRNAQIQLAECGLAFTVANLLRRFGIYVPPSGPTLALYQRLRDNRVPNREVRRDQRYGNLAESLTRPK